ncbi:hypothetical protein D3C76_1663520 [compost metagenome]
MALLSWGMRHTLLMLVAVLLVGLLVSLLWAPETKNLSLVEAADLPPKPPGKINEHSVGV